MPGTANDSVKITSLQSIIAVGLLMAAATSGGGLVMRAASGAAEKGHVMNSLSFADRVKKKAQFETWGDKTQKPATRFHHLLLPPAAGLGDWKIDTTSHPPGAAPALDWQVWNLKSPKAGGEVLVLHLFEYPTVLQAHEALIDSLSSITRGGVDYTPTTPAPGDVFILDRMTRDNLLIEVSATEPVEEEVTSGLMQQMDHWLLDDWPRKCAGTKAQTTNPLVVLMESKIQTVAQNAALELSVKIKKGSESVEANSCSCRFLAEPGRIEWQNGAFSFRSSVPGKSVVTLSVIGADGEFGQASLTLTVTSRDH